MSILFYRRPDYTAQPRGPLNASDCAKYIERARSSGRAIPPGLSFEEIIGNKALPVSFIQYIVTNSLADHPSHAPSTISWTI